MSARREKIDRFCEQIKNEWLSNIVPFWSKYAPDKQHGGFRGWIGNDLQIDERADKGVILNARILWTFSHAYKLYQDDSFASMAERAYKYFTRHFIDPEQGGVFWNVDYQGRPSDTRKRVYAQAFAAYGLTEYFHATGCRDSLLAALEIFNILESRCRDRENDGYFETFERDWTLAADQRLSEVDLDEKKSMNTHLHVLEAYATICRVSPDERIKARLRAVTDIFLTRIINPRTLHLQMFFDEEWASKSDTISFGHDIEASWLLCEAAEVAGDNALMAEVQAVALRMAESVYENGLDSDGSLLYEAGEDGITDDDKHSWTQAEAVVGFVNAYQLSGREYFLEAAMRVWEFIDRRIVDRQKGEWFWKVSRAGAPALELPKLSQWKCPYHNSRMWFEISRRLNESKESSLYGSHGV